MRAIIALLFTLIAVSSAAAESIDIGPAVGASIPKPFAVLTSAGAPSTFDDLKGPQGAVLVFVRSASWCPYCIQQLRDIQAVAPKLAQQGYPVVSISYDAPDILAGFVNKFGITYKMTSDKDSAMIDAFGIRDPQYKEGSRAYGVPMPGIFVVDKDGLVRAKLAEDGYKNRPPSQAIVEAVNSLKK